MQCDSWRAKYEAASSPDASTESTISVLAEKHNEIEALRELVVTLGGYQDLLKLSATQSTQKSTGGLDVSGSEAVHDDAINHEAAGTVDDMSDVESVADGESADAKESEVTR